MSRVEEEVQRQMGEHYGGKGEDLMKVLARFNKKELATINEFLKLLTQ